MQAKKKRRDKEMKGQKDKKEQAFQPFKEKNRINYLLDTDYLLCVCSTFFLIVSSSLSNQSQSTEQYTGS